MKRHCFRLSAAIASLMLSVTLVSCLAMAGEVNITHYWPGGGERDGTLAVIEAFEKEHPEIKVIENPVEHDTMKATIGRMLASGTPPDVYILMPGYRTEILVNADLVMDISDLWEKGDYDKYFPGLKEASSIRGKQYMVPIGVWVDVVWYNKAVFDGLGLSEPGTWCEFLDLSEKIKDSGVYPFTAGYSGGWSEFLTFWFQSLVAGTAGPDFFIRLQKAEEKWQSPEVLDALRWWKYLIEKEYFVPEGSALTIQEAITPQIKGRAAMYHHGAWADGWYREVEWEPFVDYDFFAFPNVNPWIPDLIFGPGNAWQMAKNSRNPEEARILLDFWAQPEAAEIFNKVAGGIPANVMVAPGTLSPMMQQLQRLLKSRRHLWNFDHYTHPMVTEKARAVMAQIMTAPEDYETYATEVDEVLAQAFEK